MKRPGPSTWPPCIAKASFTSTAPFVATADAWDAAQALINTAAASEEALEVLGDFVIPPTDGHASRDFQTLHHDFGLPLVPAAPTDTARFTALHIANDTPPTDAVTRLVPLRPLLAQHEWPDRDELIDRFARYGESHGAWDGDTAGYIEGSLARVVEAALGQTPVLPNVKSPGFLCGNEFRSIAAEMEFFATRDLSVEAVAVEIQLRPGHLLIFENLTLAHGRRGTRQPGELHQRIFGHRSLAVAKQLALRERILAAFTHTMDHDPAPS